MRASKKKNRKKSEIVTKKNYIYSSARQSCTGKLQNTSAVVDEGKVIVFGVGSPFFCANACDGSSANEFTTF